MGFSQSTTILAKNVSLFVSVMALTACAGMSGQISPTNNSKSSIEDSKNNLTSTSSTTAAIPASLRKQILQKKPANSGTKKIREEVVSFYDNLEDCDSAEFYLRDLPIEEIGISNHNVSTISSSLNVMGYQVLKLSADLEEPETYTCDQLPIIVSPSIPEDLKVTFR